MTNDELSIASRKLAEDLGITVAAAADQLRRECQSTRFGGPSAAGGDESA